jgi:branched-chain amino acid transport system ATP-binding protein
MDGTDITSLPPYKRVRLGLCHIPEGRAIFRSMTVRENLELHAPVGVDSAVDEVIGAFPVLGQRINQIAGTLSGGEQQMLAIARTFVHSPKVIMVDEASLGLAPIVVETIFGFLATMSKRGASLLIVDQYASRALSLADRVYVMNLGEVVFSGTPEDLTGGGLFERYLGGA